VPGISAAGQIRLPIKAVWACAFYHNPCSSQAHVQLPHGFWATNSAQMADLLCAGDFE